MPITEAQAKAKLKLKLKTVRDNVTDPDEALDGLVDALYEIVKMLQTDATVIGVCPSGGGPLTLGKIT
ncbi:hypothetical protein [Chryseobacterium herbae]|uniref:Uncharacterized protein n=1 Tax=Chryseobacterium herbae TaxID=2976476 RepID=A0ABT2IYQ8_9FLAO|nr:hypothetical protein [Chryseobacterium sp. pc1-10]MCT2563944.1 hypothetical protein [Chryseobacterium sp. pc1-10]